MKTAQEFREFYDAELRGVVAGLEALRKQYILVTAGVAVPILGLTCWMAFLLMRKTNDIAGAALPGLLLVTFGPIVGALMWFGWSHRLGLCIEADLTEPILRFATSDYTYKPEGVIEKTWIERSMLLNTDIDRYSGAHFVTGTIGKTAFSFSHVHAEAKNHTDDGSEYDSIFKGWIFVADFNKRFRGHVAVVEDLAERAWGRFARKAQRLDPMQRGELVELEDPEFEWHFAVYSDKQVTPRYILDSATMSRIVDLKQKAGRTIALAFFRSHVLVALHGKHEGLRRTGLHRPIGYERVLPFFEDAQLLLGIVDDLDLNTRIWTKE